MGEQTHSQTLSSTPPVSASASASAALPATTRASDPASAASTSRASAAASRLKKKEANASPDPNPAKKHRLTFSIPGRPLSAAGEVGVAIRYLRAADPALAAVIDAHEPPVFQCPHRPFHSLVRSILYQQLAFKAAASVYSRFLALLGGEASVAPDAVLALSPHQLRQIGVSPRKASYLHDLARKYASGILSDASIVNMDDRSLAAMLTMVKGIGAWSVHMFMIFSLARPDVLPSADLGVRKGVQMLYALQDVPRPSQMDRLCERWRPYRSVGAWYMWRLIESKVPQPAPPIPALPSPDGQIMLQQQQQQSVIQMIIPF
jgi:DNA-3-methyladenine glycosylase II